MIEQILRQGLTLVFLVLTGALVLNLLYKLYIQYYKKWFYSRQGVKFVKGTLPLFGDLFVIKKFDDERADTDPYSGTLMLDAHFGRKNIPLVASYLNYFPVLFVRCPKVLNDLYVSKNKYFDKFPLIKNILYPLMGDSILLAESSEFWSKKRKSLSQAFYKEKLIQMCELVKKCMRERVTDINEKFLKTGQKMDLIHEISKTFIKVILVCGFGVDLTDEMLDYIEDGVDTKKTLPYVLRNVFHESLMRWPGLQLSIFPETVSWYLSAHDRETRKNIETMRALFLTVVQKRREEIKKDPESLNRGDLLTILLTDELFMADDKMIIDECLTFFFAATQTSSMSTQNMTMYMLQEPRILEQVRKELRKEIVDPYTQSNPSSKDASITDMLNFENIFNLTYYNQCFMESLRIEPPVLYSSHCTVTEDVTVGEFRVQKGDPFTIDMLHLHHNPDEWIEPEKYIPERFDPESQYFLTPFGKKRHPMSFGPFLGGKRICLGKTFVETVSKITGPSILANFDFEFLDKQDSVKKPANNMMSKHEPQVFVKVSKATF